MANKKLVRVSPINASPEIKREEGRGAVVRFKVIIESLPKI